MAQIRFLDEQAQAASPLFSGRFDLFSIAVILAVLWLIGYGVYKARLMPIVFSKINWRRLVVSAVLAVWLGHAYGHVRYHAELSLVTNKYTYAYLSEIVHQVPVITVDNLDRWCLQATLVVFVSAWLLLKAKARRE